MSGLPCVAPPKDQQNLKPIIQHSQNKMKEYTNLQRFKLGHLCILGSLESPRKDIPSLLSRFKAWQHLLSDGKVWNAMHLAPAASCVTTFDTASLAEDSFKPLEAPQTPQLSVSPCNSRLHRVHQAPVWSKDYVT